MTTATRERPAAVLGSTYPRISTPPLVKGRRGPCGCGCALTPKTSFGFDVEDFARDVLHRPLDPWQRYLVIHAGELLPGGLPRFRIALVLVPRQNGKTEVCVVLSLFWLFVERVKLVLGTSTKLDYARESWDKAVTLAEDTPALAGEIPKGGVRRANGEQTLSTVWGGRYKIAASNREGGRSLTVDKAVLDELREHATWDPYNAIIPAQNAVEDAQAILISNMGDEKSVVLNALRSQAIEGKDQRLGIFEWSSPDGMAATDVAALAMANPNLGRRISLDALMGDAIRAQAAGGEQLAMFMTEVHCRYVPLLDPAIDLEAWDECKAEGNLDHIRDRVALCLDVSLDQLHATLYAAAVDEDKVRVDVVQAWEGQTAILQMRAELPVIVERVQPRVLGWFPNGPAAAAAALFTERDGWPPQGVELEAIRSDLSAVCMGFAEQVRSRAIAHSGDPLLDAHVRAAEKLYAGDGWRFTRKGTGQVDAAYAAAGATHLARTLPPAATSGGFFA
jgi:hypothetical protein